MKNFYYFIVSLIFGLTSIHSLAAEYAQLTIDLDGDNKPESIAVSTSGSGDFQNFTVQIGSAAYTGKYFAVDGDLPEINIISIDRKRPSRQLLITTSEPAWCNYHILAYSDQKILSLLQLSSDANCFKPELRGNGKISVSKWKGFWRREENYRLDPNGTQFTLIPQDTYSVGVIAFAKSGFDLEKAQCQTTKITKDSAVHVEKFEPLRHRYFIKTNSGVCGWLQENKLNDYLDGLAWAG